MSVLIKNMEMPSICDCCDFCDTDYSNYRKCCRRLFEDIPWEFGQNGTLPDCPLVEVETPHGRLIDVDGFKQDYGMGNECADCEQKLKGTLKSCEYDHIYSNMDFCQWLDNAETIIEAEGSE